MPSGSGPKPNTKLDLPKEIQQLGLKQYRDGLKVRVFAKNFKDKRLDEILGPFRLGCTGVYWWILSERPLDVHGFERDPDLGWCRGIIRDGTLLTDILIVGVEEEALHPKAHKKRNFRKIKT